MRFLDGRRFLDADSSCSMLMLNAFPWTRPGLRRELLMLEAGEVGGSPLGPKGSRSAGDQGVTARRSERRARAQSRDARSAPEADRVL